MKKIRKQILLVVSIVFLVLAVCSVAVAADVSGNSTTMQAQDRNTSQSTGHNSTNTNSVHISNTNANSSQLNTVKVDSVQINTVESSQSSYNSTNFSSVSTSASNQPPKVVISGKVTKCSTGRLFPGATVTAEKDGIKLASTITKEDGTYNLEFSATGGVFDVTASYPGHESSTKEVNVTLDFNGTLQGSVDFQLGLDDVYVSPTGYDSTGDGTQAKPYQTIGKGIEEVNAGGRVHLADGTYRGTGSIGLTIDKNVTIVGQSQAGTVIDAQSADRIFTILPGNNVTLQNLTLENGYIMGNGGAIYNQGDLTVNNCTFTDNTVYSIGFNSGDGGAIYNQGDLTVNDCTFKGNSARFNGFIGTSTEGSGGAIYNTGTLNVTDSTFTGNIANVVSHFDFPGCDGGAIFNSGDLTVNNCTFTDNSTEFDTLSSSGAGCDGGAIYNKGNLTVNNCTFTNNVVFSHYGNSGGAIYNEGNLTVKSSDFTDNTADFGYGGAIYNNDGTLNVTDSTFSGNNADFQGGAIFNSGDLTVNNCTFTGNSAIAGAAGAIFNSRNLTVNNCTFTGNSAISGGAIFNGFNDLSILSIENSTFIGNYAWEVGGAIYNYHGTLKVRGSNFENNTAKGANLGANGGAIWNSGNATINFNRIVGNSPSNSEIYSEGGIVDARLNWWGSNDSPTGKISTGPGGVVLFDPWLVLTVRADPTTINNGDNSTITADLLHDNHGTYHDPTLGHVPDGIPITLTASWGSFNSPSITLGTVNGSVTTTFHADSGILPLNPVEITATADNATVSAFITIIDATNPGGIINIIIGGNSSVLSPNQSQAQNQAEIQTQNSINTNNNSLTNENVNMADSISIATNINNVTNANIFNPVIILGNLNNV